jgi:hypothetical protein
MPEWDRLRSDRQSEPVVAYPITTGPRTDDVFGADDGIEVIDLDSGRHDIKPTTWH